MPPQSGKEQRTSPSNNSGENAQRNSSLKSSRASRLSAARTPRWKCRFHRRLPGGHKGANSKSAQTNLCPWKFASGVVLFLVLGKPMGNKSYVHLLIIYSYKSYKNTDCNDRYNLYPFSSSLFITPFATPFITPYRARRPIGQNVSLSAHPAQSAIPGNTRSRLYRKNL